MSLFFDKDEWHRMFFYISIRSTMLFFTWQGEVVENPWGKKRRDLDYSFLVLVLFIFKEKRQLCPVNLMSDFHYPLFHGLILADLASNKYVLLHHKNANKSNPAL